MHSYDVADDSVVAEHGPLVSRSSDKTNRRPTNGKLEPGALGSPEGSFEYALVGDNAEPSYADTSFFRLRLPFQEHNEHDSQDWRLDVDELRDWVINATGIKVNRRWRHLLSVVCLVSQDFDALLWRFGSRHCLARGGPRCFVKCL